MRIDSIRALASYGIAAMVVIVGLAMLFFTRDEPAASDLRVLVAGFIGSSLTFVYGSEVQTRTARQAAAQTYAASSPTNGSTTAGGHQ